MIQVIANQHVRPDKTEIFLKLAAELVSKTNRLDEGCIEYGLYRDLKNPNDFIFTEKWKNQELLERHPNIFAKSFRNSANAS